MSPYRMNSLIEIYFIVPVFKISSLYLVYDCMFWFFSIFKHCIFNGFQSKKLKFILYFINLSLKKISILPPYNISNKFKNLLVLRKNKYTFKQYQKLKYFYLNLPINHNFSYMIHNFIIIICQYNEHIILYKLQWKFVVIIIIIIYFLWYL